MSRRDFWHLQAWHGDLGSKLQELQEFHFKNTGGYCENTGDPNVELTLN